MKSAQQATLMPKNNICDKCEPKPHVLSYDIADTGICSVCGSVGECWDHDLVSYYRRFNLTDKKIWENLPRLRNNGISSTRFELFRHQTFNHFVE